MRTRNKFGRFGVESAYPLFEFELCGHETPCRIWQRSQNSNGYGKWRVKGYPTNLAHKLMYLLYGNEIPEGLDLDHLCRQRLCVRPDHLEPVSRRENARRGARAKLSHAQILETYAHRRAGKRVVDIAAMYGVTDRTICQVWAERNIYEN